MKKTIRIILPLAIISALIWFFWPENSNDINGVSTNGTIPVGETPVEAQALPSDSEPTPTIDSEDVIVEVDDEPNPWDPYVGKWTGSVNCHSGTYREGEELIGTADLIIHPDGSLTLHTERRFVSDGSIHGEFSEDGHWPGRFDERDGQVYFSESGKGMVKCIWLGTTEQNIVIPLSPVTP